MPSRTIDVDGSKVFSCDWPGHFGTEIDYVAAL
jgi:hypothetical protein